MSERIRTSLGPFAIAFETVFLPYVWRNRVGLAGNHGVKALGNRLRRNVAAASGYPVHPALICHGLRLCCHYHLQAAGARVKLRSMDAQRELIDLAYGRITQLEEYFGTYRLRLFLY